MIYSIGTQKIKTPEVISSAGRARTPHQVVPWRDMAETCRTLDAVCSLIPYKKSLKIIDGIARGGFWGAVFRNRWPDCKLILNEFDETCHGVLNDNFPNDEILANDFETWVPPKCDILIYDFDAFTLKKLDQHANIIKNASPNCKYMIIAESACFGFKFGNIKHYGVDKEEDYYQLVNDKLQPLTGKSVIAVSKFSNAAMVLLGNYDGDIQYIPQTTMKLARGGKPYIGDYERNMMKQKKQSEGLWGQL